jgi:hypothetical protein
LARVGRADQVAALIAFLASDDATFITGSQHVIDGGLLAGQMVSWEWAGRSESCFVAVPSDYCSDLTRVA